MPPRTVDSPDAGIPAHLVITMALFFATLPLSYGRDWGIPRTLAVLLAGAVAGLLSVLIVLAWRRLHRQNPAGE